MFPPVRVCQEWVLSSHTTVWVGLVNCAPPESVTCQNHQTVAPGGSEPDWRMSQLQATLTSGAGVTAGKALACTVPQVSWFTPYSSTTSVMFEPALNSALKMRLSGKVRRAALLTTVVLVWACAGAARLPIKMTSRTKTKDRNLIMEPLSLKINEWGEYSLFYVFPPCF